MTAVAGLTGLHHCDPEDVDRHAVPVITELLSTCPEDPGDQEVSVAAMACVSTLLTTVPSSSLDPVLPDLATRVKVF